MTVISKLETTAVEKSIPGTNITFYSSKDTIKDPDYSPQRSLQLTTSRICQPAHALHMEFWGEVAGCEDAWRL